MAIFQKPPKTQEEFDQNKPLAISPEEVLGFDEAEWHAKAYRGDSAQLTVRAVLMGTVLGFFLSFTNIYVGLKTGWFLGVAITACILSFAIWSALRKFGIAKTPMTILESNCMQSTASSAGYATGNILISAVPALLMLSVTPENPGGKHLPWYVLGVWVLALAALGVVMAIPMKRNMINRERLKFPSGTAAAVTLQGLYSEGKEAMQKARALLIAAAFGVLVPLLKDLNIVKTTGADGTVERSALLPSETNLFDWILPKLHGRQLDKATGELVPREFKFSDWHVSIDHSLVLVAAGAIVGLRASLSMVGSALVLIFALGPSAMTSTWTNAAGKVVTAASGPGSAWKEIGIWWGAPLMVAYGLVTFGIQWRTIARAFTGLRSKKDEATQAVDAVEVPNSWFVWGATLASLAVVAIAWLFFDIPPYYGVLAVLMCFFLSLVAARATGETDITPGGPLGKIVQLTYGVLMPQSVVANLMTASITSGSSLATADLLNDLKSGYLLGANPRRQFLAQFFGIFTGAVASTLAFFLLVPDATALTGDKALFTAPGAQQWKAVAELFKMGIDNLHPMARSGILYGSTIGIVLAFTEALLPKQRQWLPSATGIGLGLLLPFQMHLSFLIGATAAWAIRRAGKRADAFTVPIASGLIAGESIVGVIVAGLNNLVLK